MTAPVPADVLSRLKAVLGEGGWSQDPDRLAPKLVEWRDRWSGTTPLLVLPRSTAEVAAIVGVCAESGTAITPQGGNTGLVGASVPDASGPSGATPGSTAASAIVFGHIAWATCT